MTVETFTVQCFECMKWRIIPTKEQYEMIGEKILEQPWVCEDAQAWRQDATCEDPPDLSEDEPSILWAVDRHSIPCAPDGFYRKIVIRGEMSAKFADVYVHSPPSCLLVFFFMSLSFITLTFTAEETSQMQMLQICFKQRRYIHVFALVCHQSLSCSCNRVFIFFGRYYKTPCGKTLRSMVDVQR